MHRGVEVEDVLILLQKAKSILLQKAKRACCTLPAWVLQPWGKTSLPGSFDS